MVSGIDLVGKVVETKDGSGLKADDQILINGFGIGTDHYGGFSQMASVRSDWCQPLPQGLDPLDAARIGTAGYTAMLCVDALVNHGKISYFKIN